MRGRIYCRRGCRVRTFIIVSLCVIDLGALDPDTFDSATLSGGKLPASGTFMIDYTFTLTTTGFLEPSHYPSRPRQEPRVGCRRDYARYRADVCAVRRRP